MSSAPLAAVALSALLLSAQPQAASAPSSRPAAPVFDEAALEALIKEAQEESPLGRRIAHISKRFLHTPYAASPLGEGAGQPPDEDPRFTVERFDCTTYVETVVAMSLAEDLGQARRVLDAIRYQGGEVDFAKRKHFPMAQWVPLNVADGFFVDITRRVGGDKVRVVKKRLDLEVWERRRDKSILPELRPDQIPQGTFALPVIPLADAAALADRIPDGTVVTIVRENFKSVPIRVSHQGLLVRRGKRLFMRHALLKGYNRVVDVPFERYLQRLEKYGKWPVVGINLLAPQEPPQLDRLREGR